MTIRIYTLLFLLLAHCAGLHSTGMGQFIQHLGNASNFNRGGSFSEQSAGHYTAGGMMIRQRQKTVNLINVRLPSTGGTCGDFDMRFGGLSFIKGQELATMLKAAAQGVPSYALQLALKTLSPQVEGVMTHIRTILQKMNSTMLNDCLLRQQMLSAVLPTGQMHDAVCRDMERSGGNSDYFSSMSRCQREEQRERGIQEARNRYQDLLAGEFNLVWHVLKKIPRFRNDHALAQFIMSLTGTIISQRENEHYKVIHIEPRADEERFLNAHLNGGDTTDLACNETDRCLNVTSVQKNIPQNQSLAHLLVSRIEVLKSKYIQAGRFTDEEMVLLSDAVNLPLYKYIQVSAAARQDWLTHKSCEYMAWAILIRQFEEIVAEVIEAVAFLESVQMDATITEKFKKRLEKARDRLKEKMRELDSGHFQLLDSLIREKEKELRSLTF